MDGRPRPELEEAWDSVIEHGTYQINMQIKCDRQFNGATVYDIPVSEATIKGFGIPVPTESMARFPAD